MPEFLRPAAKAVAAMMNRGVASQDINEVVARTVETRVRDVLDQDAAAKTLEGIVPELKTDRRVLVLLAAARGVAFGSDRATWLDRLHAAVDDLAYCDTKVDGQPVPMPWDNA